MQTNAMHVKQFARHRFYDDAPVNTRTISAAEVEKAIRAMRIARARYLRDDGRRVTDFPGRYPTSPRAYIETFCRRFGHKPVQYSNGVFA